MARYLYGGTAADVTTTQAGQLVTGATLTVWDSQSGGTQITDLQDATGAASTVVTSDAYGRVLFYGPDGENRALWLQGSGPRMLVRPAASIMPANDSVDTVHLKNGSVTSAKIADGTIVDADISASAAIARSKISGLPTTSTDNTVPRFDGTTGALQGSGVTVDDNNRLTVASGSTGGLEVGVILRLAGSGDPSGVSAPIGSEYIQTNANATYGSLVGIRWLKLGSGTVVGTDWFPDFGGRWISYTPTITAQSGSFTTVSGQGSWTQTGKIAHVRGVAIITTNGTAAVHAILTLPVNASTTIPQVGHGRADGVSGKSLAVYLGSASAMSVRNYDNTYPGANGEVLRCFITYEVA